MSDHHAHAHTTPDDDYLPGPASSGYEHTDAETGPIAKFLFWLVVLVVLTHLLMGGMFKVLQRQSEETTARRYPLADTNAQRLPPEPRLQTSPTKDLVAVRAEENAWLASYGWVDKAAGTVHIPIEDAMQIAVTRVLRTRPDSSAPGMVPFQNAGATLSNASAGRLTERRRQ